MFGYKRKVITPHHSANRFFQKWGFVASPSGRGGNSESGSVIIWILVAVALFAALNFAFTKGFRTGESTVSDEKARLLATEILDYGRAMKQAVQLLQINGCSDTEISFENSVVLGYNNPSAPADDTCDVFEPEGAGLRWQAVNNEVTSNAWFFQAEYALEGAGNADTELLMSLSDIPENICENINNDFGINNPSGPPTNDSFSTSVQFAGAYNDGGGLNIGDNGEELNFEGIMTGCFDGPPSGTYYFYQVLIAR